MLYQTCQVFGSGGYDAAGGLTMSEGLGRADYVYITGSFQDKMLIGDEELQSRGGIYTCIKLSCMCTGITIPQRYFLLYTHAC
jgi:hypothetical protein